jgi:hypothetical protein
MFATPANLGIVAYAQVNADGNTPDLNSGVKVTYSAPFYTIKLPGGDSLDNPDPSSPLQEGQKASPCRDLVFITLLQSDSITYYLEQPNDYTFTIEFSDLHGTHTTANFNILILRSLISPPTNEDGTQAPA